MKLFVKPDDWSPWFAWHPVCLQSGTWVWLETVERQWQQTGYGDYWLYLELRR